MQIGGRRIDVWMTLHRVLWITTPVTAGDLFAGGLDGRSTAVRVVAAIGAWTLWTLGVVATLVPHPLTLTATRLVQPGAVVAGAVAAVAGDIDTAAVVGLAALSAAGVVALTAPVGAVHVNGAAYGDERRLALRPPGPLLLGPIPLAWAVPVATVLAAPLLLAARSWLLGLAVVVVGGPLSWVCLRALHGLAQRWLVFVPAGLVVHDRLALVDPVLFRRRLMTSLAPARADTVAFDATAGALGPALELALSEPVEIAPRPPRGAAPEMRAVDALLVSPSRPGAVLREAEHRRLRLTAK